MNNIVKRILNLAGLFDASLAAMQQNKRQHQQHDHDAPPPQLSQWQHGAEQEAEHTPQRNALAADRRLKGCS